MKMLIREYEGERLVYIYDSYTGKGYNFKNKNICKKEDMTLIENKIISLRQDKKIKSNKISSMLNKNIRPINKFSDQNIFKTLFILYTFLILVLVYLLINTNIKEHFTYYNHEQSDFVKGVIIFCVAILLIHEMSHAFVARISNIEVVKIGFRLKYYIFPILFVRVRPTSFKQKKINIAFVGLVSDLFLLNSYIILSYLFPYPYIYILVTLQFILTLYNYNILFPTDFTQSIFTYFDISEFRKNSSAYLKSVLKRENTFKFDKISIIYLAYSCGFIIFWLFIFINMVIMFIKSFINGGSY
ncbi:hypothetical protein [Staphylococcus pseudintermedius]|uniref:hypothetical protein n=1 Tax=Staphylococcus pseudintermedius TaxID=283734 RepID=UPI002EDA7BA6